MSILNKVKIFSGSASYSLAMKIAEYYGTTLGDMTLNKFSDGEMQPSYNESIRGCDLFLVQSTTPPGDNLLELLLMIDAAKRASANSITVVIPYYGYARQDRKDKPRVSIGSKMIADVLSAAGANRVITMDLHAPQIQGFFNMPVDHLDSSVIFIPYIKSLNLEKLVIAAPDVGASNRNREYAKSLGVPMVICDKERRKANEIAGMTIIGDVTDADVVLVDDLCDTAGTLTKAAELFIEKGAKTVRAFCTHAVLSGPAYERINNSKLTELIVTDTIPLTQKSDKIRVVTIADLFADVINKVVKNESISTHFIIS